MPGDGLIGHAAPVAAFRAAFDTGAMPHAWLLSGPPGIGKGVFARAAAAWVLAKGAPPDRHAPCGLDFDLSPDHPTAALLAAGSHLDFRLVERVLNPNVKTSDQKLRKEITIDQIVRRKDSKFEPPLNECLRTTPALGRWRVVIIDAIDEMNRSAANALLKYLEEPPPGTLFLCVSHAPGRLLPTLRSRCRRLAFRPLGDTDTAIVLRRAAPDLSADDLAALVSVADGAPGRALRYAASGIAALTRSLDDLAAAPPGAVTGLALGLSRSLALKAATPRYEALLDLAPAHLARRARTASGVGLARTLTAWEAANALAASALASALDPQAVSFELAMLVAGARDR